MSGAGEALAGLARSALRSVAGLNGVHDGLPVQASLPFARIDLGEARDWGWKGGEGRELRLGLTVRDDAERAERVRGLLADCEAALLALSGTGGGWRVVSVALLRSGLRQKKAGEWTGVVEVRVRMEAG